MRAGLLALVGVTVLGAACGGHGRASGTIVFESSYSGHEALYSVRPDGTGLTRVPVDLPPDGADVAWTRDGSKALVMYDTGAGKSVAFVYEMARHTRRPLRRLDLSWISDAPWSPDGTRLAVATNEGAIALDLKTGRRSLLDTADADQQLSWSGDGKDLLFTSGFAIDAAPADGRPKRQIVELTRPGVVGLFDQRSSSDGKWISFVANGAERTVGLYAVRSNGTGLRLVDRHAETSAWSPTGERLAFAAARGIGLVDVASGRRRQLTRERIDDPANEPPAWSPDGKWILYRRDDLGAGVPGAYHQQLWAMKADGSGKHPVTRAFPVDSGDEQAAWVTGPVAGTPEPRQPPVSLPLSGTTTTDLPVVGLAAEGDRAAVAQGFGGLSGSRSRLGPIVVWNRALGTRTSLPVHGCGSTLDVLLVGRTVAYRCTNEGEGYRIDDSLRLGETKLVRTHGDEFTGSFLRGVVADGHAVVYGVAAASDKITGDLVIDHTRVWKATGTRKAVVRTFRGDVTVASAEAGRIAVLRDRGSAVSLFAAGGGVRTFRVRGGILGAGLDGARLLVLQANRLSAIAVAGGRRVGSWPVRRGFGPAPQLDGARGDLAAYVVGARIHVLRLRDGREMVLDTPGATAPAFARFVPSGLFYAFNAAYAPRPGRLAFVALPQLERALDSRPAAR